MHKKLSLTGICLIVLTVLGCKEEKIIVPKPDSILTGWVKRADEFRRTIDTSHAGVKVWVDGLMSMTNGAGQFQINLGQRTQVSRLKYIDQGSDTLEIAFANIRLRYEGEFQERVFLTDTIIYSLRSTTKIDSVFFRYTQDSTGPKLYEFIAQIDPSQDSTDRAANLRLGSSPAQAIASEFGQLLFQETGLNTITFQFTDSIIAPGAGRFLPGSTVYFTANGTSANSSNSAFWRETSLFRMGLNRSNLQSTPIRQVVLP